MLWSDPIIAPYRTCLTEVAREVANDDGWTESTLTKFAEVCRALIALQVRGDGGHTDAVPADPEQVSEPDWLHHHFADAELNKLSADAKSQEDAAVQAILGRRSVAAKNPPRRREQPLREAAKQAIAVLWPNGIPSHANLPNKKLVAVVCEYMIKHLGIATITLKADGSYDARDTVLRAADRK